LHVWILLQDPLALDPDAVTPGALLRELIRVPADAAAGGARVFVPVERPLGLLLMARDAEGRPLATPPLTVNPGPPVARVASPVSEQPAPAPPAPPPETDPKAIPLIFARGGHGAHNPNPRAGGPSLDMLARGIAARFGRPPARAIGDRDDEEST
jgi:hypothetical protein